MGSCSPCGPWTELTLTQMWLDSDPHRTGSPMGGPALREDPDLCAWRLGGEEFLLLLRERNAPARAESRRQAITSRISALVPGLPAPVIASMGLVELPRGAMLATGYAELYARADRLLYEAKRNGRNRTVSERLKTFAGRRGEPRKKPQAA